LTIAENEVRQETVFRPLLSCVLEITPWRAQLPHLLVPDSLCPLGRAFTDLCRSRGGLNIVDIRGPMHLNLEERDAYTILDQITISRVLCLCPLEHRAWRRLLNYAAKIKAEVYSAVRDQKAPTTIQIPPVWGPMRGRRSASVLDNWTYECRASGSISAPTSAGEFALAGDVAARIYELCLEPEIAPTVDLTGQFDMFTSAQLFAKMKTGCQEFLEKSTSADKFKTMIAEATPFPPNSGRALTLSFVTIITELHRVVDRFQLNLETMDIVLSGFPDLPFEIIVCFDTKKRIASSVISDFVHIPQRLESKIRSIHLPRGFASELQSPVYPEYAARNVGIRRALGEFIISFSSDIMPHWSIFQGILDRTLTPFSLIRAPRAEIRPDHSPALARHILSDRAWSSQQMVRMASYKLSKLYASGDWQGCHFTMWQMIRGYHESHFTYHIDSRMQMDLLFRLPTILFRKTYAQEYHLYHTPTSMAGDHLESWIDGTGPEEYESRRSWGHANVSGFPPVVL
jgi:hypothetical protein